MLNLIGLESCGFRLPTISFIIFHDFGKFVLLNSNCSSMYSFSLFLRSEVNLLLSCCGDCDAYTVVCVACVCTVRVRG